MSKIVTDLFRDEAASTNKKLVFSIPGVPPSVNNMYINTRRGGKKLTYAAERYIRDSRALVNQAIDEQRWHITEKNTWLYVDYVFYFPDRKIRDASNCLKILLDVMQGSVYVNDVNALPRIQSVEYDKDNPRVELQVSYQSPRDRIKAKAIVTA